MNMHIKDLGHHIFGTLWIINIQHRALQWLDWLWTGSFIINTRNVVRFLEIPSAIVNEATQKHRHNQWHIDIGRNMSASTVPTNGIAPTKVSGIGKDSGDEIQVIYIYIWKERERKREGREMRWDDREIEREGRERGGGGRTEGRTVGACT